MDGDTRQEVLKALAYGQDLEEIANFAEVSVEEIERFQTENEEEIEKEKLRLEGAVNHGD